MQTGGVVNRIPAGFLCHTPDRKINGPGEKSRLNSLCEDISKMCQMKKLQLYYFDLIRENLKEFHTIIAFVYDPAFFSAASDGAAGRPNLLKNKAYVR